MTDDLPDSPIVTEARCPTCHPDLDFTDGLYEVHYCDLHPPDRAGAADHAVDTSVYVGSGAEAGGESNRAWCALLHRERGR